MARPAIKVRDADKKRRLTDVNVRDTDQKDALAIKQETLPYDVSWNLGQTGRHGRVLRLFGRVHVAERSEAFAGCVVDSEEPVGSINARGEGEFH